MTVFEILQSLNQVSSPVSGSTLGPGGSVDPGTLLMVHLTSRLCAMRGYQYSAEAVSPSPIDEKFVIFTLPSGKRATMSRVPPIASITALSVEI